MLGHMGQLVGQEGDLAALGQRGPDAGDTATGKVVGQKVGVRVDADVDAVAPRPLQDRAAGGAGADDPEQAAQFRAPGAGPGMVSGTGSLGLAGQPAAGHRPGIVAEGAFGVAQGHAAGPIDLPSGIVPRRLARPVEGQAGDRGDHRRGEPAAPTPQRRVAGGPPMVWRCRIRFHDLPAVRAAHWNGVRLRRKVYRFAARTAEPLPLRASFHQGG
jgi:hypothetical protein